MAGTTNHWKLGLFVVSGFVIAFGALVWLGQRALRRQTRLVTTYFDESVQGLDVSSPVKFRGVTIGTVSRITVAPDKRHVEVQAEIYLDVMEHLGLRQAGAERGENEPFVPPNVRVQLASAGITGVKFIQVDFFDPETHPVPRLPFPTPWAYVPAAPSTLKSLEESVTSTLDRLPALGDKVGALIDRIDQTLVDLEAGELSSQARALMSTADTKLEQLDVETLSSEGQDLLTTADETLKAVRELVVKVNDDHGPVLTLVDRLNSVATTLEQAIADVKADETAASLRATSEAVGDVARETTGLGDDLKGSLVALRDAAESVRDLADMLKRDPASLLRGVEPAAPPPLEDR